MTRPTYQSRPDRLMPFRMHGYVYSLYQELLPKVRKGGLFPYPLAVVLHHGIRPWKHVPEMRELIAARPEVPNDILNLPICLIDAAAIPPDSLRGHPVVCALLDSLQGASAGRLRKRVGGVFDRLQSVRGEGRLKAWMTALATYYGAVEGYTRESVDALNSAFATLLGIKETDNMTPTILEHYFDEGVAKGMAEGTVKGMAEGKAEVVRTALREKLPVSMIANLTGLSVVEVEWIAGTASGE